MCRSRDALNRSVDPSNPLPVASASAVTPLARHSAIRARHFVSVSFFMQTSVRHPDSSRKDGAQAGGTIKVYVCSYRHDRGDTVCDNSTRCPIERLDEGVIQWI